MKAIVFGATGVVGAEVCKKLISNEYEVYAVVRKLSESLPSEVHQVTILVQQNLSHSSLPWKDADVYVAIGTTKKKTPDQDLYYAIDHDIPVEVARVAQENGARSLHVVSAMGANPKSSIFYNATKGKMERDVLSHFPKAYLYRPSLIMGERSEARGGEKAAKVLFSLLNPILPKSMRGVTNVQIAHRMCANAKELPERKLWMNAVIPLD